MSTIDKMKNNEMKYNSYKYKIIYIINNKFIIINL
jgi:hypothetical protein